MVSDLVLLFQFSFIVLLKGKYVRSVCVSKNVAYDVGIVWDGYWLNSCDSCFNN